MSRATIILLIVLIAIIAAAVWLSGRSGSVTPHHIEKVVMTLNGAANANP